MFSKTLSADVEKMAKWFNVVKMLSYICFSLLLQTPEATWNSSATSRCLTMRGRPTSTCYQGPPWREWGWPDNRDRRTRTSRTQAPTENSRAEHFKRNKKPATLFIDIDLYYINLHQHVIRAHLGENENGQATEAGGLGPIELKHPQSTAERNSSNEHPSTLFIDFFVFV